MTEQNTTPPSVKDEKSLKSLVQELIQEITALFRQEVALAKAEAHEKASQLARGAIAVAVGAVFLVLALIVLLQALVVELSDHMDPALAALLVGAGVAIIGIALLLKGKSDLKPEKLAPHRTSENISRDAVLIKERV